MWLMRNVKRYLVAQFTAIGSGTHPATYLLGTGDFFPVVKRPGREADHSPTSSAEVKNGDVPPLPHTSSWRCA
jgi:hypothetical protein